MHGDPTRCVTASHGMVSTGHRLSTLAALDTLKDGGNAVDAAIAASAVSCVVLPQACGLGGDAFAVGYTSRSNEIWALNGSGLSPLGTTESRFGRALSEDDVCSCTVPGIVHSWNELLSRHGTKTLPALLEPAVAHAKAGFAIDQLLTDLIRANRPKLVKHPDSATLFFPGGEALKAGDTLRQPALADTLRRLASFGLQDYYTGETGRAIHQFMQRNDGLIRLEDLSRHRSRWEVPLRARFDTWDIAVTPPNSIALLLLAQLQGLSATSYRKHEHNSGEYIDIFIRTKRRVFRTILPSIGDPETMSVRPGDLVAQSLSLGPKDEQLGPGEMKPGPPDTTCIVVVDSNGNAVSLIQSIFHHFGCGATVGETGIVLNNRMLGFTSAPGQVNTIAASKRPAHTLSPALVLRDDLPYLAICTPGAYAQTQTLSQVLVNFLILKMELQHSVDAPRWFDDLDHTLLLESRIDPSAIRTLENLGHKVKIGQPWDPLVGNVQAVLIRTNGAERVLYGAADSRRNGCALGW